jgi:hypothetical protein
MPARQGICTDSIVQVCFQGLTGLILFTGIYRQGHPALRTLSVKITGGMCMQTLTFGPKSGGLPTGAQADLPEADHCRVQCLDCCVMLNK